MELVTLLSRIQFGIAAGFHFLFPATTLGLTLFILIYETLYLRRRESDYQRISIFLSRILAVVYVMGIATGGTLEFSFGTNWDGFSRFAGSVFGMPVAAEAITAFALEAGFIGILLFGRNRVPAGVYWVAAFLVFFGSHLSGLWILAANTWMQVPGGFTVQDGRAVATDWSHILFNGGVWLRFGHTVVACWMAGSALVAALAAGFHLKQRHAGLARRLLGPAAILLVALPIVQLELGHLSAVYVDEHQKAKSAALEGVFETRPRAPLIIFGIPDEEGRRVRMTLGIPSLLSLLVGGRPSTVITGLNEFPRQEWPPVNVVFTTFHFMVAIGFLSIGLGLVVAWLAWRKSLPGPRWFLWVLVAYLAFPYLAIELGWMTTEIGRQPWVVYGLQRTAEAASGQLRPGHLAFSLASLSLLYAVLFGVFLFAVFRIIRKGPPDPREG